MKLFTKLMVQLFLILSITSHAQTITIKKLLDLQQSNQITMQDYLETSSWKLYKIVTLKEADSILFHSSVFPKLTNNYKA